MILFSDALSAIVTIHCRAVISVTAQVNSILSPGQPKKACGDRVIPAFMKSEMQR